MKQKIAFILLLLACASCMYGLQYADLYQSMYDELVVRREHAISGSWGNQDGAFGNLTDLFISMCLVWNIVIAIWLGVVWFLVYQKKSETKALKIQSKIILIIAVLSFAYSFLIGVADTIHTKNECEAIKKNILQIERENYNSKSK